MDNQAVIVDDIAPIPAPSPRAVLRSGSLDLVEFGREFSDKLELLRQSRMQLSRSVILALGDSEADDLLSLSDLEALAVERGVSLPPESDEFMRTQGEMISEFFQFMQEAAELLKYPVNPFPFDVIQILSLARGTHPSVFTKEDLAKYVTNSSGRYSYLVLLKKPSSTTDSQKALIEYVERAKRIQADVTAAQSVEKIWTAVKEARDDSGAFTALCVPSGTGKTQLAFNLPLVSSTPAQVIYMNMSLNPRNQEFKKQAVYRNFEEYMSFFSIHAIPHDMEVVGSGSSLGKELLIHGVTVAILELLNKYPDLNFPEALARIAIVSTSPPAPGYPTNELYRVRIMPQTQGAAAFSVKTFEQKSGRRVAFFLDEFTAAPQLNTTQIELAFLRRALLNSGGCVIVASTDSGAVNMLNSDAAADSRGGDGTWVRLIMQLPLFVSPKSLVRDVQALFDDRLKQLLHVCLKSRPLFAGASVELIENFVSEELRRQQDHNPNLSERVATLVEGIRDALVVAMELKVGAKTLAGCYGYVVAMLTAGYTELLTDEVQRQLLVNLTTRSWAFLLNEKAFREDPTYLGRGLESPIQNNAGWSDSIQVEDEMPEELEAADERSAARRLHPVIGRCMENIFLDLLRKPGKGGQDYLFFQLGEGPQVQSIPFFCSTYFPKLEDDFLLYLVLAGSLRKPGLHVHDTNSNSPSLTQKHPRLDLCDGKETTGIRRRPDLKTRISAAQLIRRRWLMKDISHLQSSNAVMPDHSLGEMIAAAAFMTASNCGAITGCGLEEFVTRFVMELVTHDFEDFVELQSVDKIKWAGEFTAQFIWPFDSGISPVLNEILTTVESTRPPNRLKFDAGTFERVHSVFAPEAELRKLKTLLEVKTSTKLKTERSQVEAALKRQDAHARVSFIVVQKSVKNMRPFSLKTFKPVIRSKIEGSQQDQDLREARLVRVTVDSNLKICLVDLSESTCPNPNRLIFLISTQDLYDEVKLGTDRGHKLSTSI